MIRGKNKQGVFIRSFHNPADIGVEQGIAPDQQLRASSLGPFILNLIKVGVTELIK
ncbi:hypothetical protein ES703_106292 [subsurface metagenome]